MLENVDALARKPPIVEERPTYQLKMGRPNISPPHVFTLKGKGLVISDSIQQKQYQTFISPQEKPQQMKLEKSPLVEYSIGVEELVDTNDVAENIIGEEQVVNQLISSTQRVMIVGMPRKEMEINIRYTNDFKA